MDSSEESIFVMQQAQVPYTEDELKKLKQYYIEKFSGKNRGIVVKEIPMPVEMAFLNRE